MTATTTPAARKKRLKMLKLKTAEHNIGRKGYVNPTHNGMKEFEGIPFVDPDELPTLPEDMDESAFEDQLRTRR